MAHSGSLASTSNRKARCQVDFFLSFGMSHVLTYMLLKTLGRWLTGSWNVLISSLTLSPTLLCCTTAMTWPTYSVPVTGYHLPMTPSSPGGSPLVLEWRPIRSFLPRLKWVSWQEAARSPSDYYRRMNKWYSWRKLTRERLLPLPERGHSVSSWVPWTWKASWEPHVWCWACLGGPSPLLSSWWRTLQCTARWNFHPLLRQNCSLRGPHFPPPAIVEALQDYVTHYHKVRRLHLIVVDLWRPWKYNTARAKAITDQLWYISHSDATHRVSPLRPDGPEPPLRCRRFAYGYGVDGSECPSYLVWPQRDGHSYVLLDTSTNDTLSLNQEFFRPLGMEHFYDSFALESQISVRREAMRLFGLREDELMPDLHITRDGVLRIRLGAHQEHEVNHVARATDRTKVSAAVIQLASHEEDTAPKQDMSEGDASDSDGSESASDSEQNDPPSSLVADAEQYELMQRAYAAVGEDFTGKDDLIGAKYSKLLRLEMVQRDGHWQGYPSRCRHVWITSIACWRDAAGKYKPHVLHPLNHSPPFTSWRNVWLWSWLFTWPKRSPLSLERFWHTRPRSCTMTVLCIYYAPITGYSRFTRNYCTHRPAAMPPGNVKENDPAVAWHGLQRMPNHPNSGGRRLLARASVTGLEVPVRLIPYRYGFLHQWCCNSCRRRRTNTGQSTRRGWMRK